MMVKQTEKQASLIERIESSTLPFKQKVDLYNSLTTLQNSESKLDKTLAELADKLFIDGFDDDTVSCFNTLMITIQRSVIDFSSLGQLQRVSYLKMLGMKASAKMSSDELHKLYEKHTAL